MPILLVRKRWHKEVKSLAQSHKAGGGRTSVSNGTFLTAGTFYPFVQGSPLKYLCGLLRYTEDNESILLRASGYNFSRVEKKVIKHHEIPFTSTAERAHISRLLP